MYFLFYSSRIISNVKTQQHSSLLKTYLILYAVFLWLINQGYAHRDADLGQTQPAMMSFKAFLGTQDDNISDEEAIRKYNEYKLEFKRQQLNDFFVNHKDEEWWETCARGLPHSRSLVIVVLYISSFIIFFNDL